MKKILYHIVLIIAITVETGMANDTEWLLPARKYARWGFIDKEGEWVIPSQFEAAYHFSEGLAAVKYYGKWGYIDRYGKWIIKPSFRDAKPFREGLACVKKLNRWGYIDKTGEWHIKPELSVVSSFSDGKALVKKREGFVFIDRDGRQILRHNFNKALPFAEGLAFVIYNGYKGYIDQRGNWLIKHNYEEAYSFSEGLALIKDHEKYGFINQQGRITIAPRYEDAGYFHDGLAPVKKDARWGYINQNGGFVIQPKFEAARPFFNGYAVAKMRGKYGLINKKGQWIISPSFGDLGRFSRALSLGEQVMEMVKNLYAGWQLKGEFEKTSDYLKRVSKENMDAQIRFFTEQAINALAGRFVKLDKAAPGLYDADNEKFTVFIPGAKSIRLPVPLEYAKEVKDNWDEMWFVHPKYALSGDEFLITSINARYKGHEFHYNINDEDFNTANPTLDIRFNDIAFDIPRINELNRFSNLTVIGRSDVDIDIPVTNMKNEKTFALVIGNEDYSSFQMSLNTDVNVSFASIDAITFKKYLINTLGVPDENITLLINATAGQMKQAVAKLSAIAQAYQGEAQLIFYYAGHGLPKEGTNEPYIIPVDVGGTNLDYALKLEDVFRKLTEYPAQRVTVFIDACFSGGARNEALVAARGIRIKPKSPFVNGNLVVFSASSGEQTAYPYREKAHGIFTYYLLKALQISNGEMSYGELDDFIRTNVMRKSVLVNNKVQTPQVMVSPVFETTWRDLQFYSQENFSSVR